MNLWLLAATAFVISVSGTGLILRYARQRRLVDIPNERSSHERPTPRGGGLSFVLIVLLGVCWVGLWHDLPVLLSALLPALLLVAVVGWLDDHRPLPAAWRAACHVAAVGWFVVISGGLPSISLGPVAVPLGWLNIPILILCLTWLTNLYNFMDGADGLAATQAIMAVLAGAVLLAWQGAHGLASVAVLTAAGAGGFLLWNRPPARIFMGDVGSCFLGFLLGALGILGEQSAALPGAIWTILLGYFIWDASLTLLLRMWREERWYHAHRGHAYQRLLQLGWGHRRLALAFICYNLLISWPLAAWGYYNQDYLPAAFAASALVNCAIWAAVQVRYAKRTVTVQSDM